MTNIIFESVKGLIKDLSGEGDSVPADVLENISHQARFLKLIIADPSCIVVPALAKYDVKLTAKEVNEMCANVKQVATCALEKHEKHFSVIVPMLKHRFMYSPRNPPLPPPSATPRGRSSSAACPRTTARTFAASTSPTTSFRAEDAHR